MLTVGDTGEFVLHAPTPELQARAVALGFDKSLPASIRAGYPVYYTDVPYAAGPLLDVADGAAHASLFDLKTRYDASWQADPHGRLHPHPSDREPFPFQHVGPSYALDNPTRRTLIGDEMGLGKTVQAILLANAMQSERNLAVVPGNTRLDWVRRIREWTTIKSPIVDCILASRQGVHPRAHWTVISYELSRSPHIRSILMRMNFGLIVFDEIHYLKTVESKRTVCSFGGMYEDKALEMSYHLDGLESRAEMLVGLTGTPLPNRPREAFTVAKVMCPAAIDDVDKKGFEFRFNPSSVRKGKHGGKYVKETRGRLGELRWRLRCNLMIRRLEADVGMQIPEERYSMTYLEPNAAIRRVLTAEGLLDFQLNDFEDLHGLKVEQTNHIATLRKEMGLAKLPRLIERIKMQLESIDKLVVFAYHREVTGGLYEKLASFKPAMIRGGMTATAQDREKLMFRTDPECKLFIGQETAAGTGTDGLQDVCHHIMICEPPWSPGNVKQIVHRLKRFGQHENTLADIPVAPGSLDEKMIGGFIDKLHVTTNALDHDV